MKTSPSTKANFLLLFLFFYGNVVFAQGLNHALHIGYNIITGGDTNVTSTKARLLFSDTSVFVQPETRKMPFMAEQANISDENGNLLMVSNGCWIANSTGDTMQNGSGLNPGPFTNVWCDNTTGMPYPHAAIFLPWPGDSTRYMLFHQTSDHFAHDMSTELFYSVLDMTLDGGLGGVVSNQKNVIAILDTIDQGIAACRHANGRDWWIVALRDSSDIIYKVLLTDQGIASVTTQHLNVDIHYRHEGQPLFSPDGKKFAYTYGYGSIGNIFQSIRIFNFDRCSGQFSLVDTINYPFMLGGLGLSFSPNSKYLYYSTFQAIFQFNTDTTDIALNGVDTVALNDGYYSPYPPFQTDFWLMYLAANGKIYISSGNSVIDMHYINYPDSAGLACDVQQHALHLPCYSARGNVNHPNYYLGCDTTSGCPCLTTSIDQPGKHNFKFSISPNPTSGNIKIVYMLPQNKSGVFEIFDINGKKVFSYSLPPWSTMQNFSLPRLADGIYNCIITSAIERVAKKLAVFNSGLK